MRFKLMEVTPEENLVGCPAKTEMVIVLRKQGSATLDFLSKGKFVYASSFDRHIEELISDNMARWSSDKTSLLSTEAGNAVAYELIKGRKEFAHFLKLEESLT